MDMSTINHLAVITAAISSFVLGGIWYGPLFGRAWMKEVGLTEDQLKAANQAKIYGLAFLFTLVMSYNLAMMLNDPSIGLNEGIMYGGLTGLGFIAMGVFVIGLFERRSMKLMLINGGFMTISMTVIGAILGAWR